MYQILIIIEDGELVGPYKPKGMPDVELRLLNVDQLRSDGLSQEEITSQLNEAFQAVENSGPN